MRYLSRLSLVLCILWISQSHGNDTVIQIFTRKAVNTVSDSYINFAMDPNDLLNISTEKRELFSQRILELGPSFLKILGNSANNMRLTGNVIDIGSTQTKLDAFGKLYNLLKSLQIKPIIVLPYNPKNWNTRDVMRILSAASKIDMNNCIWQLGADFHSINAVNYIDDLTKLKTMVDVFSNDTNARNWTIVGSDLTVGSSEQEARLYSELSRFLVEAVGWSQPAETIYSKNTENLFATYNIDPALRTVLNSRQPIWLSLSHSKQIPVLATNFCSSMCLAKGLNWAQTLGDAARNGFNMVFAPINNNEWFQPSLSHYVNLLHKQLMGRKVFDTPILNGNRFDTHFYSHCTKNNNGAFTIFGVNMADSKARVAAKVPFKSGSEFLEYILSVNKTTGRVQLNGQDIVQGATLTPITRVKRLNKPALLLMPPNSTGFWVFPTARILECERTNGGPLHNSISRLKTSSEALLQQLMMESINREDQRNAMIGKARNRRSIVNSIWKGRPVHFYNPVKRLNEHHENSIQKKQRRSIAELIRPRRMDKLVSRIYNSVDNIKRKQIQSQTKLNTVMFKRSKRQVPVLAKLFETFDFKRPILELKPPAFNLVPRNPLASSIPPIATIHDIYAGAADEKKIFESAENPNIPSGDVHFEVGEEQSIDNVNDDITSQKKVRASNAEQLYDVSDETNLQSVPHQFYENTYDSRLTQPLNQPQFNQHINEKRGELWEATEDRQQLDTEIPSMVEETDQNEFVQPTVNEQNIEFVMRELGPTWKMNRDNLAKTRSTLQQYYVPVQKNNNNNLRISNFLPNVANIQPQSSFTNLGESDFFESKKRRRRSIDDRMNDEIEAKLQQQQPKNDFVDVMKKMDLFNSLIEVVSNIQRNKTSDEIETILQQQQSKHDIVDYVMKKMDLLYSLIEIAGNVDHNQKRDSFNRLSKLANDAKKLGTLVHNQQTLLSPFYTKESGKLNALKKKSDDLSISGYLDELRQEDKSMVKERLFKRDLKRSRNNKNKKPSGDSKKVFLKTKSNEKKQSRRGRRSVLSFDSSENYINMIPKEMNEELSKLMLEKKPFIRLEKKEEPLHVQIYNSLMKVPDMAKETLNMATPYVPKFLKAIRSSVDNFMDMMTTHVSDWWESMS